MSIRLLEISDYDKGFMKLINFFTKYPQEKTKDEFIKQFYLINSYIYVLEKNEKIIATGALHIENKFHNNFKNMAHIQDIVVDATCRKQGYGKMMINFLIEKAKTLNCYKIVLNANKNNKIFYEKFGFISKGDEYNLYLN